MAENPIVTPEATEPPVEKTSRFKNFTINHPRTAKVVGIAAATAAVAGVVAMVRKAKQEPYSAEAGTLAPSFDDSSETPTV